MNYYIIQFLYNKCSWFWLGNYFGCYCFFRLGPDNLHKSKIEFIKANKFSSHLHYNPHHQNDIIWKKQRYQQQTIVRNTVRYMDHIKHSKWKIQTNENSDKMENVHVFSCWCIWSFIWTAAISFLCVTLSFVFFALSIVIDLLSFII